MIADSFDRIATETIHDHGAHEGVLPALGPVIHAQPRLRITVALAALSPDDMVTFPRLQELAGMTAGNLATHLRKLEAAGYITITKSYRRRSPVTNLALTRLGRRALEDYTAALRDLLAVPAAGSEPNGGTKEKPP
jgi:DNA-binding MarR family transcriptional regulator